MLSDDRVAALAQTGRYVEIAKTGDPDLGPLAQLPGVWKNTGSFQGHGWNLIALPFEAGPFNYRLLMNQYDEELHFSIVDKGVPNRGINMNGQSGQTDQRVITLDYDQKVTQIAGADSPDSGIASDADCKVIHREPGLWLHMANFATDGLDIARLGSVPHGDSLLALGRAEQIDGAATITPANGLPLGVTQDIDNSRYLAPYKHFIDNPFKGNVSAGGFPGFRPDDATALLRAAQPGNVVKTTVLHVDSTLDHAGVTNIPFIVRQADVGSINSTFWIYELDEKDETGAPRMVMQYVQSAMLDFFGRRDGNPGLIQWPHISINTMQKVSEPKPSEAKLEMLSS